MREPTRSRGSCRAREAPARAARWKAPPQHGEHTGRSLTPALPRPRGRRARLRRGGRHRRCRRALLLRRFEPQVKSTLGMTPPGKLRETVSAACSPCRASSRRRASSRLGSHVDHLDVDRFSRGMRAIGLPRGEDPVGGGPPRRRPAQPPRHRLSDVLVLRLGWPRVAHPASAAACSSLAQARHPGTPRTGTGHPSEPVLAHAPGCTGCRRAASGWLDRGPTAPGPNLHRGPLDSEAARHANRRLRAGRRGGRGGRGHDAREG